ncbi:hypothetical protein CANTEDRAFT_116146 [Yamadazyma tenuis ATCC 10573]|uniref:Uncharacterized protein n=1 Tax=Candida tenuis (strain ATCC 10573 / BCRC 21748 / CBS 615 / JCM 9827 / NBRC 10315 / NRRL Y-1498 / VKM Y-70) TaxID=590646 RepID=G3BC61_CANTC|nr:uncharacterized protein CANTEDRAFT_116146 [Yamadazyma tenuis ATCC 10573]EGV60128.1 hypothetical protein CANTEDRAFT_116146 [Yamadazyma tenuis ATCC 10573]
MENSDLSVLVRASQELFKLHCGWTYCPRKQSVIISIENEEDFNEMVRQVSDILVCYSICLEFKPSP